MGFFDLRRAVAGMLHFLRCDAKKDGGVRTLVLSVFRTSGWPETQIKGTMRKSGGVLQIICWSRNVSSGMERKAQRRTFRDSTLMGEAGCYRKRLLLQTPSAGSRLLRLLEKRQGVPFWCHRWLSNRLFEALHRRRLTLKAHILFSLIAANHPEQISGESALI
jgi:hypothetical protein